MSKQYHFKTYRYGRISQSMLVAALALFVVIDQPLATTILSEGFEGSFPGSWTVNGSPTWGRVNACFGGINTRGTHSGSYKGYCAGSNPALPHTAGEILGYANFNHSAITVQNFTITPAGSFSFDTDHWKACQAGAVAFTGSFWVACDGNYALGVTHLTSASAGCQGGGFSPVTIKVNGTAIASGWDPAQQHGGSHGWVTDTFGSFHANSGWNTIQWSLDGNGCSCYWIQGIALYPMQPNYWNNMSSAMSRTINLSGYSSASLSFWYCIPSIESGYDSARIYLDGTQVWSRSSAQANWTLGGVDLTPYVGGAHTLKFEFDSDSSNTAEGWYLDDILLEAQPAVGSLQVTINPSDAVSAGAQWQVDGGAWHNSGDTVSSLSTGSHTVVFSAVSGWTTPSPQAVTITSGSTTTASGTYIAQPVVGSLQVTISPPDVVSAGAQWQVDSGAWHNSGDTVSGLSTGSHTVVFSAVSGWTTPSPQAVTITSGSTTTASGTYIAQPAVGSLQVTISPSDAVSAGAQWQVDGAAWHNSGDTVSGLTTGSHNLVFKAISGWNTPASQAVTITSGSTTAASGTYSAQAAVGSLQVTISPSDAVSAGAQWQVDSGAWHNSGDAVSSLSTGSHTVAFSAVSGWTTPLHQAVSIVANTTTTTSGTYGTSCSYALSVTSAVFGASGGTGNFAVDTGSGCSWTAVPCGCGWVHTTASNTGPGMVAYTVDANTSTNSRMGSITVGTNLFAITQAGVTNLPVSFALAVASVNPSGGVTILATPNDTGGLSDGTTPFMRSYLGNTIVTLTAPAGVGGNPFQAWHRDGVVLSRSRTVTVLMDANHTVTALYQPPVQLVKASYNGLFYQTNEVLHPTSGCFTITTTAKGKFSGTLQIAGSRYSISGQFDASGHALATVARRYLSQLTLDLQLGGARGVDEITGTISDGNWVAELSGDRAVFNARTSPVPQAGKYTLVFPGSYGSPTEPAGYGYGTLVVDASGKIRLTGCLAEGTKITQAGVVSGAGQWPLYIPLYRGEGSVLGWLTFANTPTNDLSGAVSWIKLGGATGKYYPGGFSVMTSATGSRYDGALLFSGAQLVLSGGNLPQSMTNRVGTSDLRLTFTRSSGLFRGTVLAPTASTRLSFSGVVLEKQGIGCGWFPGGAECGSVWIAP